MNDTQTQQKKSRRTLLLLVFVFALPYAAAMYFYMNRDNFELEQTNYGTIINPVRAVQAISFKDLNNETFEFSSLKGKWVIATIGSSTCAENCQKNIYHLRQIQKAVGKDRYKLKRLFILTDTDELETFKTKLTEYPHMKVVIANEDKHKSFLDNFKFKHKDTNELQDINDGVFFIDPNGDYMMGYPGGSPAPEILKDLQRVLKLSRVGNMI